MFMVHLKSSSEDSGVEPCETESDCQGTHWNPLNSNSLNCKSANYQPLASQAIGSELNTPSASFVLMAFLPMIRLSFSLLVGVTAGPTPSGAMVIPVVELEERPFFTFVDLGTFSDSRSGEVKGESKEPALSSGDTESLSPSSGLSFLICLRILASALDPELDSVRPASNPTSHNNGQQ